MNGEGDNFSPTRQQQSSQSQAVIHTAIKSSTAQHKQLNAMNKGGKNTATTLSNQPLRPRNGSKDRTDEAAARAALTMAAVAQAASANNKSPATAAEIAKVHAQNITQKQHPQQQQRQHQQQQHAHHRRGPGQQLSSMTGRPEPRRIQPVPLESVKSLLRSDIAANSSGENSENRNDKNSRLLGKLANGENDAFLQQLLLMEYLKASNDEYTVDGTTPTKNLNVPNAIIRDGDDQDNHVPKTDSSTKDDGKTENWKTTFACERVKFLLRQFETAYGSMEGMLPAINNDGNKPVSNNNGYGYDFEDDLTDTPKIVPDFLPPCTTKRGDNTLAFFRACSGESSSDEIGGINQELTTNTKNIRHDLDNTAPSGLGGGGGPLQREGVNKGNKNNPTSTESSSRNHSSVPSSILNMFSRRPSLRNKSSFLTSFTKRKKGAGRSDDGSGDGSNYTDTAIESDLSSNYQCEPGEYVVIIEREMLGLTVENVLERTVVRTVLAAGPAKKAGAKVGSLIVKVGNIETKNLTHFETIDELRQSQRPLQLVLRQIPDEALQSAREEMGRLIRGAGFGRIIDGEGGPSFPGNSNSAPDMGSIAKDSTSIKNINIYSGLIRKRWIEAVNLTPRSKKCEPILRVGEKLIWIMTLFVIGLEREAEKLFAFSKKNELQSSAKSPRHSLYNHSAQDYADAAKSASKVLFDFVNNRMDPSRILPLPPPTNAGFGGRGPRGGPMGGRGGRGGRGRVGRGMYIPGTTSSQSNLMASASSDQLLLQIGDVLQRMRTFLADPTSPPAAMLRGELIACLCDILDADTEMKLSEEENFSSTQGGNAGIIADLGSAGTLLKLIVLNCPIMRSPECEQITAEERNIDEDELRRRSAEKKEQYSSIDYHRLHAGNRFLAVVHRLAASRSTSARITACSLGPVLWSRLDFPHQLQLRGVITRALHDVEVIVRKSTATVLHEIAELVYDSRCVPWLVLMCERAMTDPEPQLRSAAMTLTWHLAEHLPNAFLGDASKGSRYLRRLPSREDPIFADVYLLQCKLLPVATRLAEDRAPHVRLAVAAQCERLCDALGDHWSSVIIDVLVALLTDSDERVRGEAVLCVPRLADIVLLSSPPGVVPAGESSVLDALLPAAIKLQKDPCSSVRVALATAAGELLTLLVGLQRTGEMPIKEQANIGGPMSIRYEKRHVDERLIPLVQKLLHDADPEVTSSALRAVTNASRGSTKELRPRFDTDDDDALSITSMQSQTTSSSVEKNDPVFLPVLSEEQVLRLLPTLSELANSKQWRVRQSAVEIVPALLGCTDKFETRADIARLCIRLTNDRADAVRKTAAECLCLGGTGLGSHGEDVSGEWITALVIPQMQSCAKNTDYRQRLLCLKMVEVILMNNVCPTRWKDEAANTEGKNTPMRELLKLTLSLADDRIANVRLNVGLVLGKVIHVFGEDECRVIKYALLQQLKKENSMEERRDKDVDYYATKCLERVRLSDVKYPDSPSVPDND